MRTFNRQPGDFDPSFGMDGIAEIPPFIDPFLPRNFTGMALQGDNILVAALVIDARGGRHCGILRLEKDGTHDLLFGDNGLVVGRFNQNEHAQPETLVSLEDGNIVVLGFTADPARPFPQPSYFMTSRNGQGPSVVFPLNIPEASAMVIGSGRLVASLTHFMIALNLYTTPGLPQPKSRVFRMDNAGKPDFGRGDFIEIDIAVGEHEVTGLALSSPGFLVSGTRNLKDRAEGFIARYSDAGELDHSFGRDGYITLDVQGQPTWVRALVRRPKGELIVLGNAQIDTKNIAFAWQFTAEGLPDPTFNNSSPVLDSTVSIWHNATLDDDGKLIAFGRGMSLTRKRYLVDGTPDPDYLPPSDFAGIEDAMMCLPHGTNTLFGYNASGALGVIGTIAAIQN